jgi:hypothetical protein
MFIFGGSVLGMLRKKTKKWIIHEEKRNPEGFSYIARLIMVVESGAKTGINIKSSALPQHGESGLGNGPLLNSGLEVFSGKPPWCPEFFIHNRSCSQHTLNSQK